MKERFAKQIRSGLNLAEWAIVNPLWAEKAPSLLTPLGYRAYLRRMKSYGYVSPGGDVYL